jgi:ethanolamine utilization protein EutP
MTDRQMANQRKKRIMLIGRSTAGKTTLCQRIFNEDLRYHKTQTVTVEHEVMIDTPGEYLERRGYRGALMVTSTEADIILLLQDATEGGTMYPAQFSTMFTKPCVGVVTKIDIADEKQISDAETYLKAAGAHRIYRISSVTGEGVDELLRVLDMPEQE